jgi:hypothetical protein
MFWRPFTWASTPARRSSAKLGTGAGQRWTFTATGPTTNVAARFFHRRRRRDRLGPTTADRIRGHFVLESLGEGVQTSLAITSIA